MRLQSNKTISFFALFRNIKNFSISLLCFYSLSYEIIMTFRLQFFNYKFFFILCHLEMQCVLFIERIWYHDFLIAISWKMWIPIYFLFFGSRIEFLSFAPLHISISRILFVCCLCDFCFFICFHCLTHSNKNTLNIEFDVGYTPLEIDWCITQ